MVLTEYLKGIADAIRENKKTTDTIPAENFQEEIEALKVRVDTSDATATSDTILKGTTAYVAGVVIEGTYEPAIADADYERAQEQIRDLFGEEV